MEKRRAESTARPSSWCATAIRSEFCARQTSRSSWSTQCSARHRADSTGRQNASMLATVASTRSSIVSGSWPAHIFSSRPLQNATSFRGCAPCRTSMSAEIKTWLMKPPGREEREARHRAKHQSATPQGTGRDLVVAAHLVLLPLSPPAYPRFFRYGAHFPRHRPSQVGVRLSMKAPMPSSASRASMLSTMTRVAWA
jgi:hypothetical protein